MGRHAPSEKALQAVELAKSGLHAAEIARRCGLTHRGVALILARFGVVAGKASKQPRNVARAQQMADLFRDGLTLQKVGDQFGMTRERVRQILKAHGVHRGEGGYLLGTPERQADQARRAAAQQARCEANCLKRWGLGRAEMEAHRKAGLVSAYLQQRSSASLRGIDWNISFVEWLSVWTDSGKLKRRGRGKGKYVMSRNGDAGAYELGNVSIKLATENSREGVLQWLGKDKPNCGVHNKYPGSPRPWVVTVCHKQIGRFGAEDEAVEVRRDYIQRNGLSLASNGRVIARSRIESATSPPGG